MKKISYPIVKMLDDLQFDEEDEKIDEKINRLLQVRFRRRVIGNDNDPMVIYEPSRKLVMSIEYMEEAIEWSNLHEAKRIVGSEALVKWSDEVLSTIVVLYFFPLFFFE